MSASDSSPPYRDAAVATIAVFTLYALTLAPTTAFWDTSEYITTAHILGIPHPPGNPLFVLLARSWDLLLAPLHLSVPVRINLFSAAMSALAHGCWYLVMHRIASYGTTDLTLRRLSAAAAVVVSATCFTVWNQSNVNEKVYTVSLFTIALLSWIAFRWRDGTGAKNENRLVLCAFILALSVGNHLMAFLAAPALGVFLLATRPASLLNVRLVAAALAAVMIGLSVHLYLPLRASQDPIVNQADPRCDTMGSAILSVATFGRAGCAGLSKSLAREQYGKPPVKLDPVAAADGRYVLRSPSMMSAQAANYLQYADWQFARSLAGNNGWFGGMRPLVSLLFAIAALYGASASWRWDRRSFIYMAILYATLSAGLTFYLNFKYGYTSPWRDGTNTEVRERDYFFIVSFSIAGLFAGLGIAHAWNAFGSFLSTRARRPRLVAAPVLVLALVPLLANWSWASRSNDYTARDWAYNLLMSVEPYGVLLTGGDNDTFPLWYLQEVEGIRQDVIVIVTSYLNTDWYVRQLRDLSMPCNDAQPSSDRTRIVCQRPYVAPAGADVYATERDSGIRGERTPGRSAPEHSILALTDDVIAETSKVAFISSGQPFRAGGIDVVVPAGTQIYPADIFMAHIITNSLDDRPIYFAMTTNAYLTLNLTDYLVRQGVAYRLSATKPVHDPARGIIELAPFDRNATVPRFVDVGRSDMLLSRVFVHRDGFPREWKHWGDAATEQLPAYYAATLQFVAWAQHMAGNPARADQLMAKAAEFQQLLEIRAHAQRAPDRNQAAGRRN